MENSRKSKYNDPELLFSAWYALAYYYYRTADYETANFYADKAQDWDYRFGKFRGMAHCLWLKAQIAAAENNIPKQKDIGKRQKEFFRAFLSG